MGFLPSLTRRCESDPARPFRNATNCSRANKTDDHSPTGYVQVLDEVQGPHLPRCYVYGLELIEQDRIDSNTATQSISYNVYDGHGSVLALTDTINRVQFVLGYVSVQAAG